MNPHFLPLLREAHAVCMAHDLGLRKIGEITHYCHLPVSKVASWLAALNLPYEPSGSNFTTTYSLLLNQPLRKLS